MTKKRAFTLIELLVVIAIIALLLAILLPSLNMAKEKARYLICKSGLKQYGFAGIMYLNENDSFFPHPYKWLYRSDNIFLNPSGCHWHDERMDFDSNPDHAGTLWPYLASKDLHVCPSFGNIAKIYGTEHNGHSSSGSSVLINPQYSYCMNGYLGKGPYSKVAKLTQVISSTDTFFFCEENTWEIPS